MEGKKISVIVPVYNVEQYLDKCIESIINQTYKNLEIILVDDGSPDGCPGICDEWAKKDSRIRVIHKENGGLSDARNAGIDAAKGEWLSFIDGDDTIAPEMFGQMYQMAKEKDCEIAVCNMVRIFGDGTRENFYNPADEETLLVGERRYEVLRQPSVCNKLFRAELFDKVRFPKGKFYEDTYVCHIPVHRAKRIGLTGKDSYFYLSRRDSILGSGKYADSYFDMAEAVYRRMVYVFENKIHSLQNEACLSMYAVASDGEKHIKKTPENAEKRKQMREQYREAYDFLIKRRDVCLKQKIRLVLLRYLPKLHSRIY